MFDVPGTKLREQLLDRLSIVKHGDCELLSAIHKNCFDCLAVNFHPYHEIFALLFEEVD